MRIDVGAANITVQGTSSIGGDLFKAHIEYSGRKPDVVLDTSTGEVHISQSNTSGLFFQNRRFVLSLQLNASVPWKIAVNSGASNDTLNLSSVHVSGIEVNTGASHETISVGSPSGTVPITINGGALTVNVHRPHGVATSVAVSGGAVNLSFDSRQSHAVGTLNALTSDYDSATDRYQLQVNGGACNVTVDQNLSES
ncbi:MAG: hypothetical protein E6J40_08090 [Chloroflexi bacterium]|nr:MAG: hypothetical protein E6J40_08090 [Chloroflexota bacterium]